MSFEKTDVSLKVGETHELAPVITELEGTDLVNYTVSEEGVISISGNVVTALKGGSVVITATLKEYPEVTATVNVTVDGKVKSITIDMINKIEVEGTITLKANVLPEKADNKEVEWSVSDPSILKIEGNKVVALAVGTAKVIAIAKDGSGVKAELEIKVKEKASELLGTIELSCDNKNVIVGNTVKMNAVVDTEAEDKTLVWTVSNDNATVNANGEVTFVKAGEVEVTASLKANPIRKATYTFNCKDKINSLELSARKAEYRIGDTEKLGVTFEPLSSKNIVEYASSDASIVSVDENGNITAIKTGKATITVTSKLQPEIKATVEITVGAQQIVYYVSKDLADKAAGSTVTVNGLSYVMGTTAFSDLDDALAVAKDNEAIAIAAVTYEDEYTITQTGLTIIGPNEVLNPNYENRNAEATFVNVVNVAASNVTISGVCFSKAGRIVADAAGGINDLTVSSIVFDSQITNGDSSKGCIHFESPVDNLSKNLTVINSRFEKTGKRTQALMVDGMNGMTLKNNYFEENPEIIRNMLPEMRPNHSKMEMASIEFITVHDTAGSPSTSTANANSKWCTNIGNTATSWHYTIGNDGIYQQLEDKIVGRHAGDGGNGATTALTDTGVKATVLRPECTLGEDGYIYILGQKSNIQYPEGATGITETGLGVVVGENGNYFMPTLRLASQGPGKGKNVCIYGGNANSIGIETAINAGSDVYLTWQILAKFCAEKLVQYDLNSDRVKFHNSFDGKLCPRTMMTAGLVDEFLALVDCEYQIAKNYPDAKITFKSNNPDILDDSGRVIATPELTTNVTYTITVEQGGKTESITLNAVIVGQYNIFVG